MSNTAPQLRLRKGDRLSLASAANSKAESDQNIGNCKASTKGKTGEIQSPATKKKVSPSSNESRTSTDGDNKPLPHYSPIHLKTQASILSRDGNFTSPEKPVRPPTSYAGFRNLAMITLAVGNIRLVIENYQKYGLLNFLFAGIGIPKTDIRIGLILTASIPIHLLIALAIELLAAKLTLHNKAVISSHVLKHYWRVFVILHATNAILALAITSYYTNYYIFHPFIGTVCEAHALVVTLKVASYAFTNRDLRDAKLYNLPTPEIYASMPYPRNLTLSNLVYFWWAPTLVYQPVYPTSPRIRAGFIFKRILEICGASVLMAFLVSQYGAPVLKNSLPILASSSEFSVLAALERLLKLATISMVVWLLGFFCIFQCYLNILAEILRFGDREFYQDWWNSGSVGTYWRRWNRPVSNYFKRHVFVPLINRGVPVNVASLFVFFISAVLHEILVGIPTHNIIGVGFASMLLQVPLIYVTMPIEKIRGVGTVLGNCIWWLSFFLGQPVGVLLYYLAWNLKFGSLSTS
ncbi:hypothetical protein NADFUDRAFT_49697 [Nadsonia fulvescens var. elongata DSM 6958]|uniref:O-acyltransferase n=1 Tax=Nadsonia fulvescens var. elongata DSM 6958 TaxID=857566 RepID=A0A1E3PPM3_9ASCO|nr:hypothetical protein NADFUDRAFT_49697 [Nadsonia fulvescens var. elongata DSM 6958]